MSDPVAPAANAVRTVPCPGCGERALDALGLVGGPCLLRCATCSATWDALARVEVVAHRRQVKGGCCAGFRRHDLDWRGADGAPGAVRFETWAQDGVLLGDGHLVSVLFAPGDRDAERRRLPMPYLVVDHTAGRLWSLVGAVPSR